MPPSRRILITCRSNSMQDVSNVGGGSSLGSKSAQSVPASESPAAARASAISFRILRHPLTGTSCTAQILVN